ncbi:MAG: sulfatase-like hydrolase/transferase [Lachnospiraceae bacterium]|nr:sulfatase-like hydrolase/transferase [Lachnospiraceae bacterium]
MKKIWAKESWSGFRIILMLMLLVCAFITGLRRQDFYGEETQTAIGWDTTVDPQSIPDLGENTVISQEFYAQDGILELVYVSIGAHGTTGSMLVTLQDADGAILATRELPCDALVENGAQGISFHIRVQPGAKYVYTISFSGITDEYPQLQTLPCLSEGELGALRVNMQEQEQKLYGLFVYQSYYTQNPLWWLFAGMTLVLFFYAVLYPLIPVWHTRLLPLFLAGHVVLGVCLLELAAGNMPTALGGERLFYNCMLCFFLFAALAVFLWKGGWLLKVGTILCFVIGVAEYYVLEFRGSPLHPADLLSIGTAGEVSSAYKFDLPVSLCAAFFLMLTVFALEHKIRFVRYTGKQRIAWFGVLAVLTAGGWGYLRSQPILSTGKNGGFFWNLTSSYEKYGYFLATYIYENYQKVEKPDGYSTEAVEQLMTELTETSGRSDTAEQTKTAETQTAASASKQSNDEEMLPNIIAIMNESFTDFASVGGIQISQPLLPFIDSLQENTVKGNLYVPVFGGGTANTEFEFLTGSTMQFLPTGSTPYQAYVRQALPSLASYLKQYGYETLACHFASGSNWNRDQVYPLLGFDTFLTDADVDELEEIHGYPSDQADYEEVCSQYEAWKASGTSEHFFCFNVTIQNHGGYLSGYRSPDAPQYTGGQTADDVEEYLSLLRESDRAFEQLVHYFEQEEEPTVILMFGDHWPRLNNSFINSMANQADTENELEKNQNKYVTPFVIWANYNIEETQIERLSANYLGAELLQVAGVPTNAYQKFLLDLSKEVPVIDTLGFIQADGRYADSQEALDASGQEGLQEYEMLQYAHLFGKNENFAGFFNQ